MMNLLSSKAFHFFAIKVLPNDTKCVSILQTAAGASKLGRQPWAEPRASGGIKIEIRGQHRVLNLWD